MIYGTRVASKEDKLDLDRIQLRYRAQLLESPEGRAVLADILRMGAYFSLEEPSVTSQQLCQMILERMGILHEDNTAALVEALAKIRQVNDITVPTQKENET